MGRVSQRAVVLLGMLAVAGHVGAAAPEASSAARAAPAATGAQPSQPSAAEGAASFPVESAPAEAPPAPDASTPPPAPSSPPPPSAPLSAVTIRSTETPGSLRVEGPGIEGNTGSCPDACTLKLAPGSYTVVAPDSADGHSFRVNVTSAANVVLDPGSKGLRGLGLGMIIVGGTALTVGAFALYYDVDSSRGDSCIGNVCNGEPEPYHRPDWVVPAMVAGAIGGGVALVGTALFIVGRPTVDVSPSKSALRSRRRVAADAQRLEVLPALGPTGGGLQLRGAF